MISRADLKTAFDDRIHRARMCVKPAEDYVLSVKDIGFRKRRKFQELRETPDYQAVFVTEQPLVSILIATYNRARLLRERAVRSCLEQTYSNIELVVVGDACTDETSEVMAEISDPRVRFVNLEQRGDYPANPKLRWMVAGTAPVNHALELARGDFITHLDDDDEHAPERVEKLLAQIRETRADCVFHPFQYETPQGEWLTNEAQSFSMGQVTTSSIFYHHQLRTLHWDPQAWRYREPGDWNRLRKFRFMGATACRNPGVYLTHYRERNQ